MDSEVAWGKIKVVSAVLGLNEFVKEAFSVEGFANADFENEATVFLWVG